MNQPSSIAASRVGFSLVEIVIALGVTAVALVGVLALMQIGLKTYREAMNSSVTSAIGQQVVSSYALAEFDSIGEAEPVTEYYDERGLPLETEEGAVYVSEAEVLTGDTLGLSADNLRPVRVAVTSPTQPDFRKVFIFYLARQGKDTP